MHPLGSTTCMTGCLCFRGHPCRTFPSPSMHGCWRLREDFRFEVACPDRGLEGEDEG